MSQSCKTCKWLVVEPDTAGRRVVRKDKGYRCIAPMPELPPMPLSVTSHCHYLPPGKIRSRMDGGDGADCPTWAKYVKPEAA